MSTFEGLDRNRFPSGSMAQGSLPLVAAASAKGTSSSPSPRDSMFEVMAGREPSERMQLGHFMARAGAAAVVAPIPGSIDEVIGSALLIAGVATMVSERFLR